MSATSKLDTCSCFYFKSCPQEDVGSGSESVWGSRERNGISASSKLVIKKKSFYFNSYPPKTECGCRHVGLIEIGRFSPCPMSMYSYVYGCGCTCRVILRAFS